MHTPQILLHPHASARLKCGFDRIVNLLAITLGPTQGSVLSNTAMRPEPEMLMDAATIARRIIALPNQAEDVGAMLARNLVWQMHTRVGDGSAITAVLAQAILNHAQRFVAAGGNPMLVRRGIERAAQAAIGALRQMAQPAPSQDLARFAETITGNEKLSAMLGEIFGKLGSEASVMIEDYLAPYIERRYFEGGRWNGKLVSPYLITETATRRAVITDCHVAVYAGEVKTLEDVQSLLEIVANTKWLQVALIANEISGAALTTLVVNHRQGKLKIIAAELRERGVNGQIDFEDLAALTGATVLSPEAGRHLYSIEPSDLGAAPRVEADTDELIVAGGEGEPEAVQKQIARLCTRMETAELDEIELQGLRFRLARLKGQIAKLMIGANTAAERTVLRQQAEKGIRALPVALREGVVPGGGVAYLNCISQVLALEASGDEGYGVRVLARALEEPFRRIVSNAGFAAPDVFISEARRLGKDFGCDALTGKIISMNAAGILDASGTLCEALRTAVSGAVMALTTDTIVLHRTPETSYEP